MDNDQDLPPENATQYLARFNKHSKISGFGFDTAMSYPCPFCAAPDVRVIKIMDTDKEMPKEAVCPECNRGHKAVITKDVLGTMTTIELVQTSGSPSPAWLTPRMPTLEEYEAHKAEQR